MSPEEIERRRKEHFDLSKKRDAICLKILGLQNKHSGNDEFNKLLIQLRDLDPKECEHGRSWAANCMACDDVHKEVFPEYYSKCVGCSELVDPDELDSSNHCFDCQ